MAHGDGKSRATILQDDDVTLNAAYGGSTTSHDSIVAFEDLNNLGAKDYEDLVGRRERCCPLPEPLSLDLFGAGAAGVALARKHRRRRAASVAPARQLRSRSQAKGSTRAHASRGACARSCSHDQQPTTRSGP